MKGFGRKNHSRGSIGKILAAALAGSVLGAAVALLMAPVSGEELRHNLGAGAMDVRERAKTTVGNVESRARELAEEVTGKVSQARGRKVASTEET